MEKNNKNPEEKVGFLVNYFSTPNTSLDKQRQITNYDFFDVSNESYRKSTVRIIIKKYNIK